MKKTIATLLISMLLVSGNLKAQKWTTYTSSNSGLPGGGISDIALDAAGNKWIATYEGIVKFTGTTWTAYNKTNSGLVSNLCNAIEVDKNGNVWVGTENGASKFNPATSTWTTYLSGFNLLSRPRVLSIACDSKGAVYFGHDQATVSKFTGTKWTYYSAYFPVGTNNVNCMAVDGSDHLWFSIYTRGVVLAVDTTLTWVGTGFNQLLDYEVNCITINIPLATGWFGSSLGFSRLAGSTWTQFSGLDYSAIETGDIESIVRDSKGNLWLGTKNGLVKFDGTTWTKFTPSNSGLQNDEVYNIVIDASGTLWMGNGGLVKYNPNATGIEEVKTNPIQVYPNPATNRLSIAGVHPTANLSIYNGSGQLVLSQEADITDIDVADLPIGIYVIQIKENNGISIQKFIKQ